ncbi:MAG TPA: hypothetical protein VLI69_02015 [Gammaproteobacteria bacterium]|nr:hypothetical protein [Gammaproteobacteria bacterium]
MPDRKKRSAAKSITNLFLMAPKLFGLIRGVWRKIKLETYFTIKNIIILLMLAFMLGCLLTATWISVLAILFFWLLKLQWTWYAAAALVMALNIVFLIVLGIFVLRIRDRIAFSEVARCFRQEHTSR